MKIETSTQANQLTTFLCMGGCTNQLGHTGQSPPSGEDFLKKIILKNKKEMPLAL